MAESGPRQSRPYIEEQLLSFSEGYYIYVTCSRTAINKRSQEITE